MAVISDIHSNREAFLEVLADIDRSQVESIVSLGDNIGYGPEPEEVLTLLRKHNIPSVMGNHELGIVDAPRYSSWFNPPTRLSLELTKRLISSSSLEFLKTLRSSAVHCDCLCVHGCPPSSVSTYLFSLFGARLQKAFSRMEKDICFVGHTHELELISYDGMSTLRSVLREGIIRLERGLKYIINVGSVGQPRDGDNRAKYVIWNSEDRMLEVRFIAYDVEATIRKILDLGFPAANAHRLR